MRTIFLFIVLTVEGLADMSPVTIAYLQILFDVGSSYNCGANLSPFVAQLEIEKSLEYGCFENNSWRERGLISKINAGDLTRSANGAANMHTTKKHARYTLVIFFLFAFTSSQTTGLCA